MVFSSTKISRRLLKSTRWTSAFRVAAIRKIAPDKNYVRISQFVMPFIGCVPVGREVDGKLDGFKAVYQVPADDHNTWRYDFFFKWSKPMTKEDSSKRDFVGADYRKLRNIRNNYLQDRQVQKTVNFTGIEEFLNQDACATESMGPIADRTQRASRRERLVRHSSAQVFTQSRKRFASGQTAAGSGLRCRASRLCAHPLRRCLFA